MCKQSWSNVSLQNTIFKILLLLLFRDVTKADHNINCKENEPCQSRGGCFVIEETSQPSFLSTKCVCSRGYSGRWCQFREDGVGNNDQDRKKLKALPGSPRILTQLSTISYERSYKLSWEKPREAPITPILYYALRYRIVGESSWKNVQEIIASEMQTRYSYLFQSLYWDVNYEVEVYAGSSLGVGRPATGIIPRPKIGFPEISYVSPDKTGVETILEGTPFHLDCKARGTPRPSLSWLFNGNLVSKEKNIFVTDEKLTVLRASVTEHLGVYRCVATNEWGAAMSSRVEVNVAAPVKFVRPQNHHKSKFIMKQVTIGMPAYFNCPPDTSMFPEMPQTSMYGEKLDTPMFPETPDTSLFSGISYKWEYRHKNSRNYFDIKTSERVWVTTKGTLVFRVFKQEDAELINKVGIRCIIEQKTSSGRRKIMSNPFKVRLEESFPWPAKQPEFWFLDKPRKNITLFRGESLELHCSALSKTRGDILIEWGIITGKKKRFPNGVVTTTSFGRVLKYDGVQKSDSGKIVCKAFKLNETANSKLKVITAYAFLNVLDTQEDVYKNVPRKISVFSSSNLRLGPFPAASSVTWYFNGKRLKNEKSYLEFDSDNFRSAVSNNGIYQVDIINGETSLTAPIYVQFIEEDTLDETIPADSGIKHYCLPHGTFSLSNIKMEFTPSCGSNIDSNTVTITQEAAWRHSLCNCKVVGNFYSVVRKFDMGFDGAMFSSRGKWSWTQWSAWSHCPHYQESCGKNLFSLRRRTCVNPTNNLDGEYCSGSTKQQQTCPFIPCRKKVSSFWSQWSIWSECSNVCGAGVQSRRRMCIAPSEQACPEGEWHEKKKCVGVVCYNAFKGTWGEWSAWSECSKSCGNGLRHRQRHCSDGQQCLGRPKERLACYNYCKTDKEDEKSERNEIYSIGIFYLPNMVALFTAIVLTVIAVTLAIRNCHKKLNKQSKHKRLLQDLFYKPSMDAQSQPLLETDTRRTPAKKQPVSGQLRQGSANMASRERVEPKNAAHFKHKPDSRSTKSKRPASSASLVSDAPSGKLPPPSPSLLAPSGGVAMAHSAAGSIPPPPAPPPGPK